MLAEDLRDVRSDLATMRADLHSVAVGLAEFKAEARVFMRLATWGGALLVTTLLTTGAAGIRWAASLTSEVRQLGGAVAKMDSRLSSLEVQQGKTTRPTAPAAGE